MPLKRLGLLLIAAVTLAGCSVLHLGGSSASAISLAGKSTYCGTPSQASEMHYFANPDAFQSWVDYRNISGFSGKMARDGVLVVEMGQRPTGGYDFSLDGKKTGIENGVLTIAMDWQAPRPDAAVSQDSTSQCVALRLPEGQYQTLRVVDQFGNIQGSAHLRQEDAG